jgi:hypothetical protein
MSRPSNDWFEEAVARSEGLPARLTIRQRLARLRVELEKRGVAEDDPRVPGMIAALFPPGMLAARPGASTAGPGEANPWHEASVTSTAPRTILWMGGVGWRAILRKLRWLSPLLCLLMASDTYPVPSYPPPQDKAEVVAPPVRAGRR